MMLRDLFAFIQRPYPWRLAPMGYLREVRMTARRGRDCAAAWRGHIAATRQTIEESVERCRRHGTAVVVGSGNLLDIPHETLSRAFETVVLVDIFHPRAARAAIRDKANVRAVSADVTGAARAVYAAARARGAGGLPKSLPPVLAAEKVDLIVSANLLSQLSVIPREFLTAHRPEIPPEQLRAFARDLVEAHLAWLCQSAEQVCLVTDIRRMETLPDGKVVERDIIEGARLPQPDAAWDWRIAPKGAVFQDREVIHRVHAYRDYRPLIEPHPPAGAASDKNASMILA